MTIVLCVALSSLLQDSHSALAEKLDTIASVSLAVVCLEYEGSVLPEEYREVHKCMWCDFTTLDKPHGGCMGFCSVSAAAYCSSRLSDMLNLESHGGCMGFCSLSAAAYGLSDVGHTSWSYLIPRPPMSVEDLGKSTT